MIDYSIFYKAETPLSKVYTLSSSYDLFISAFVSDERVHSIFDKINATKKHWLVFPEYNFDSAQLPGSRYSSNSRDESEFIRMFFKENFSKTIANLSICIDMTGFIRPYLMFLIKFIVENGIKSFTALYSEPVKYKKQEDTQFSKTVTEVRQVKGFEGQHVIDTSGDFLIINVGYEDDLISKVADYKLQAEKAQLLVFPH